MRCDKLIFIRMSETLCGPWGVIRSGRRMRSANCGEWINTSKTTRAETKVADNGWWLQDTLRDLNIYIYSTHLQFGGELGHGFGEWPLWLVGAEVLLPRRQRSVEHFGSRRESGRHLRLAQIQDRLTQIVNVLNGIYKSDNDAWCLVVDQPLGWIGWQAFLLILIQWVTLNKLKWFLKLFKPRTRSQSKHW